MHYCGSTWCRPLLSAFRHIGSTGSSAASIGLKKLAERYWEFLYEQFADAGPLIVHSENGKLNRQTTQVFEGIRTALGHAEGIAEELIPLASLAGFYKDHADIARMPVEFPETEILRDALPWGLVTAYRDTFQGEILPATCNESIRNKARSFYDRACEVATGARRIAWPVACAESCHVAAYATLKCEELFKQQCWHRSALTPVQREYQGQCPAMDFAFWP